MSWAPALPRAHARAKTLAQKSLPLSEVRFTDDERRLLLKATGLGHGVVCRLERVGIHSLQQLQDVGVDSIVDQICEGVGNMAWRNRRRALTRALAEAIGEPGARQAAGDTLSR
jgi:nucleotidyltransferase/DNA polymerase involved in DNA repair